jgi:hypothetical protein
MFKQAWTVVTGLEWARPFYWQEAVLCLPAMPLLLFFGPWVGDTVKASIAAGAAFSVGFGAIRGLRGHRWGAMLAATFGIAAMAFLGSLCGEWPWVLLVVATGLAALCGALGMLDDDLWWVVLQMLIALLVAGYFAGASYAALERATWSFVGGATQTLIVMTAALFFPKFVGPARSTIKEPPTRARLIDHIVRAAVCVALAWSIAHYLGLANNYWAPMTAMLLIKPGLHQTRTRGIERLTGTLLGCVVATLFVDLIGGRRDLELAGLALTAASAFAMQKANYAAMTAALTATIVLLTSLATGTVLLNAEHRIVATLLGGVVAFLVAWLPPCNVFAPAAVK